MKTFTPFILLVGLLILVPDVVANDGKDPETQEPVSVRFAETNDEAPDFQRHVLPLLGKLGCNGRACHGSFQGQGGFQLSLFGYDFEKDYQSLLEEGMARVDIDDPTESLILTKPTDADAHEGGKRYDVNSWHYRLLNNWIRHGALSIEDEQRLEKVVVIPDEIVSAGSDEIQLKAIAHWSDGTREDVTPLARFQSNNPGIATVTESGSVSAKTAGATHVVVFYDNAVTTVPVMKPREQPVTDFEFPANTEVDNLVASRLRTLGIEPSALSDDATFLRRVSLDITGTLPSPGEIRQFLSDDDPDKRKKKINQLLNSPAYASWWATFFCDLTGNNTRQLQNASFNTDRASEQWYRWIRQRVEQNVPYDDLVEGIVLSSSRLEGESAKEYCSRMSASFQPDNKDQFSKFESMPYYWMRRDFRDGETRAISFAHAFMGIRIQCAQCHKHPFDQWTQHDFQQFSRFFTGVTTRQTAQLARSEPAYQRIFDDLGIDQSTLRGGMLQRRLAQELRQGKTVPFPELTVMKPKVIRKKGEAQKKKGRKRQKHYTDAILLGSDSIDLTDFDDVRKPVMKWLRQKDNPYFAKAFVNRVWAKYMGVGIVQPADDLNLANPPSNGPLLEYLATGFVDNGYDMKWLHREIANSRTYQLSWEPTESNADDKTHFSHAIPRRLPAEVVNDAVAQASSNKKINRGYRNQVEKRAISVAGTTLPRNRKEKNQTVSGFGLKVFGRSDRSSSCDCDRSEETSLIQTVYLQNDRDIHNALTSKTSWVNELSGTSKPLNKDELARFKKAEQQLVKLRKKKKAFDAKRQKNRIQQVQKQINRLNQRMAPFRERVENTTASNKSIKPMAAIREAYLRTLSRYPTDEEIKRCMEYFRDDDDYANALTGVLWALVNTKEFIVNH